MSWIKSFPENKSLFQCFCQKTFAYYDQVCVEKAIVKIVQVCIKNKKVKIFLVNLLQPRFQKNLKEKFMYILIKDSSHKVFHLSFLIKRSTENFLGDSKLNFPKIHLHLWFTKKYPRDHSLL